MGALSEWADEQSKWLKLAPEESAVVRFISFEKAKSSFNEEREIIRYQLEVNGRPVSFDSGSADLADSIDKIEPGSWVKITRHGLGNKTKYNVEKIEAPEGAQEDKEKKIVDTLK